MYTQDPDVVLMLRFQKGDFACFDVILEKYQRPVISTIYRFIGDRSYAEDLAQEVFLRVYNARDKYRPDAKFSTWLYRIVTNLCLNELRRRKAHKIESLDSPIVTEKGEIKRQIPDPSQPLPDEILERKELEKRVKHAIELLPSDQKMAVILSRYEGLSYKDIAQVMLCSVTAVKLKIMRAKENLKKELKEA